MEEMSSLSLEDMEKISPGARRSAAEPAPTIRSAEHWATIPS